MDVCGIPECIAGRTVLLQNPAEPGRVWAGSAGFGDGARQLRTFDFKIPPRATYLDLRIGLGAHTTGTVQVERVELMLNQ